MRPERGQLRCKVSETDSLMRSNTAGPEAEAMEVQGATATAIAETKAKAREREARTKVARVTETEGGD